MSDAGITERSKNHSAEEREFPDRRGFLKSAAGAGVAVAGAGVAVAGAGAAAVAAAVTEPAEVESTEEIQYGLVIDVRRCIGCQACSVACKAEFDVPLGATRSWVEYVEKGAGRSFLPRLCNHCSRPICVDVCPTGATYKRAEDGIVVVDTGICIGCKYCIQACPYDARFFNPVTGTADKCDFCIHRLTQGLVPACVETCVGRARIFGNVIDPESEVAQLIARNPVTVLRPAQGTEPNVFYIDADHSDERDSVHRGRYVRVTTHRRHKERR